MRLALLVHGLEERNTALRPGAASGETPDNYHTYSVRMIPGDNKQSVR